MASKHKARGKKRAQQLERKKVASRNSVSAQLGRDPAKGQVAFRTGSHLSGKDKLSSRCSKNARNERNKLRELCE